MRGKKPEFYQASSYLSFAKRFCGPNAVQYAETLNGVVADHAFVLVNKLITMDEHNDEEICGS
jgi:hypothetical protein